MNRQIDIWRMPEAQKTAEERALERRKMGAEWLYGVDFEEVVRGWFGGRVDAKSRV